MTSTKGPFIPLVARAADGGTLVSAYARTGAGWSDEAARGLRSEIAALQDYGLYGSGLAAIAQAEANPLDAGVLQKIAAALGWPNRLPFLGLEGGIGWRVSDDRSADLGLALSIYAAWAGRPLGHVICTGSLRPSVGDGQSADAGRVFPVADLDRKFALALARHAETPGTGTLFLCPRPSPADAISSAELEARSKAASAPDAPIHVVHVATVDEALNALGIDRMIPPPALRSTAKLVGVAVAGLFLWVGLSLWQGRALPLSFVPLPVAGSPDSPIVLLQDASGTTRTCRPGLTFDKTPEVPIGSRLAFAVSLNGTPAANAAIVMAAPATGYRVHPMPHSDAANGVGTFELSVVPPAGYSRIFVVADRGARIEPERLDRLLEDRLGSDWSEPDLQRLTNYLSASFPGYLEYGFVAVSEEPEC